MTLPGTHPFFAFVPNGFLIVEEQSPGLFVFSQVGLQLGLLVKK